MPLHRILVALAAAALAGAVLAGCHGIGPALGDALRERPPAPLDSMSVASDARIDAAGVLAGSFVGEGTSRAVHLLSSDTALIADLARTYRPDLAEGDELWGRLAGRRLALGAVARRRTVGRRGPEVSLALVGSPLGHTEVSVEAIYLQGGRRSDRCIRRGGGAQVELVVREERRAGDPPLRGPVLGALLDDAVARRNREPGLTERPAPAAPSEQLVADLIARTRRVMDSSLALRLPAPEAGAHRAARPEVNTLADLDAADVIAFRAGPATVRYAVSLRERRTGVRGGETLVATAVMVWDSAGAWRQWVFRPTLLSERGGRLSAYRAASPPYYWRRLQPISDVAFQRDNLWMEQVNVSDGTVLWGIVQPRGNVVVAAAEVEGECR